MKTLMTSACFSALLCASIFAQNPEEGKTQPPPPLDQQVPRFEMEDGSIVDGLAELSRIPNLHLHLGIEEVLREKLASPPDRSVHFALQLEHKTVREIFDELCLFDSRYGWAVDGSTINVFPRARVSDQTDLLNFRIKELRLVEVPDPDQALTPLSKQFPLEPVGYYHMGGSKRYSAPWSTVFEDCTVRDFINRITEHIGASTSWVWEGGQDNRLFTFFGGAKGGFYTRQPAQ